MLKQLISRKICSCLEPSKKIFSESSAKWSETQSKLFKTLHFGCTESWEEINYVKGGKDKGSYPSSNPKAS